MRVRVLLLAAAAEGGSLYIVLFIVVRVRVNTRSSLYTNKQYGFTNSRLTHSLIHQPSQTRQVRRIAEKNYIGIFFISKLPFCTDLV